jgi:hypothetical protein
VLTIHQANGRGPRRDEAGQDRAASRLAVLRELDPALIEALGDPDDLWPDGRVKVRAVAVQLGRTVREVRQDLARCRGALELMSGRARA